MSGCDMTVDLTGTTKLIRMLNDVGKSPQKAVTRAASKAITPVKRAVRGIVPVGATGNLKRAITRKPEKSRVRGKKVYEVTFSSGYDGVLQKKIKHPGIYGGKSDHAYYPASQEYGFLTRKKDGTGIEYRYGRLFKKSTNALGDWYEKFKDDKTRSLKLTGVTRHRIKGVEIVQGVENRKIEGLHYMRQGAEQSEPQARQIMIDTMEKELDKLWQEAQHA